MAVAFTVNGAAASVDVDANTPLLWVVREHLKLTGTKFGCADRQAAPPPPMSSDRVKKALA